MGIGGMQNGATKSPDEAPQPPTKPEEGRDFGEEMSANPHSENAADKRIALFGLLALGLGALIGYLVLLVLNSGTDAELTALFGLVSGVSGALAMFVKSGP